MSDGHQAPPNTAAYASNLRWDPRGAWVSSRATGELRAPEDVATLWTDWGVIKGVWSITRRGQHWLIVEGDNNGTYGRWIMDYTGVWADQLGTVTQIESPYAGSTMLQLGDHVYFTNPTDEPARWNTVEVIRPGFVEPPPSLGVSWLQVVDQWYMHYGITASDYDLTKGVTSPLTRANSATATQGLGTRPDYATDLVDERWSYGYALTWVNDIGMESPPSPVAFVNGRNRASAVGSELTTDGRTYASISIPAPPLNARGMRLYRTEDVYEATPFEGRTTALYLHTEFPFACDLVRHDGLPDGALGGPFDPDRTGVWPSGMTGLTLYKGTMFGFDPERVYYSAPGLPEQFPENNYFLLGTQAHGPVTALYNAGESVLVFCERAIYAIRGDPGQGFSVEPVAPNIGSRAPNAIVTAPGVGVVLLTDRGPYLLQGAQEYPAVPLRPVFLGRPVQQTWLQRVNLSALENAVAVHNERDQEVWFQVPADGDDRPTLGFVYHYDIGQWTVREGYTISSFTVTSTGDVLFGSWDTDNPGVFHYGGYADTEPTSTYRTANMSFTDVFGRYRASHLEVWSGTTGRSLALRHRIDRQGAWSDSISATATDTEMALPVWDTAVWSTTALYYDYEPVPLRYDISPNHSHELAWEVTGTKVRLVNWRLSVNMSGDKPDMIHTVGS